MDTYIQFRTDAKFKARLARAAKKYARKSGKPERGAVSDFLREAIAEKMEREGV